MTASLPVALAQPGDKRSEIGFFVADDARLVIDRLRQDLEASGEFDSLLDDYAGQVPDTGRYERARQVLQWFRKGKLEVDALPDLVQVLYFTGQQRIMSKHHIRFPAYDILDEYFSNVTSPCFPVVLPRPQVTGRHWTLFGQRIGFPIGVPASVLTANAAWIHYHARNGFNVLTYKTMRSRPHEANAAPNWAFVPDQVKPFDVTDEHYKVQSDPWDWVNPGSRDVTTTNSFGVPSPSPAEWMADVENAHTVLAGDQLLIVSVMGDDYDETPGRLDVIAEDFAETALMAERAGASVIELNLSCPNSVDTTGVKPPLCYNVEHTAFVLERVRARVSDNTNLVAKLSYLNEDRLAVLVHRIAPMVQGIAGINTLPCTVTRTDQNFTFPGRDVAGVSGIAIREYAKDFVGRLARLRVDCGRYFEILGMGGVTDPASLQELYEIGANSVQTATGAFANPFLAAECAEELGSRLPETPEIRDPQLLESLTSAIREAASKAKLSREDVAAIFPLRAAQSLLLVDRLVDSGELVEDPEHEGLLVANLVR